MINSKITTDIMTTTGFTLDIPPAKVVINNQEITDLETFNKVVDSIKEKDKEIQRLNNIINKGIEAINVYQDSKTLSVGYKDLRTIRGILRGNDFDLFIFEEYLKQLKEGK